MAEAGRDAEDVLVASVDLEAVGSQRAAWGLFRDRRPDLYGSLLGLGDEPEP
jgi:N-carbamoylputrescine amidase